MSARLAVDNVFNPVHYPDVTLSANEEAGGQEAEFFSTLRREDAWSPTTFNADAWLKARHSQPRAIDTICLWVHNLLGEAYKFQISNDDFASGIETIVDVTIPTSPGAGDIDDALGVVTEDLLWIKHISPTRYAADFRHYVPAMGASLKPALAGLAGISVAFDRTRGDLVDGNDYRADQVRSPRGVIGAGDADVARSGTMPIKFTSLFAYEEFRFHLQRYDGSTLGVPQPGVLVFDTTRAEEALMVRRPLGRMAFTQAPNHFYPSGDLHYEEHDPLERP